MRRFARARLRQVQPPSAGACGQSRIARDQKDETAFAGDSAQGLGERGPRVRVGVAKDDRSPPGKRSGGCEGIGETLFVRHQDQGRQSFEPAFGISRLSSARVESKGGPC